MHSIFTNVYFVVCIDRHLEKKSGVGIIGRGLRLNGGLDPRGEGGNRGKELESGRKLMSLLADARYSPTWTSLQLSVLKDNIVHVEEMVVGWASWSAGVRTEDRNKRRRSE